MPVNLPPIGSLLPIRGIQLGSTAAEIRYSGRDDLVVGVCDAGTVAGGVFTRNSYRAAPVEVAEANCGAVRGFVINSGNANAATGDPGIADAKATCRALAELVECNASEVLPFSTGVIGERLPMDNMRTGISKAFVERSDSGWNAAATAIMTTDTAPKGVSEAFELDGAAITATAIVKGSGMIHPNMATMLAYLGTDVAVSEHVVRQLASDLSATSFNALTVDGDTSTNDCFVIFATGQAQIRPIVSTTDSRYAALRASLLPLVEELAMRVVRDAEGASKFVTVHVNQARTVAEAKRVALTVAHSPLVKTAFFGGDPNWGRFCMAIGNAELEAFEPYRVTLQVDDVRIAQDGLIAADYAESKAAAVMAQDEFDVTIALGRGSASTRVWTSDLSYEYVRINADYRS